MAASPAKVTLRAPRRWIRVRNSRAPATRKSSNSGTVNCANRPVARRK
uniref:Uncharacterized protein n=1 Tax=Arundo donax TaxID=35708 RepID=A0A0A9H7Y8_ARUDO